MTTHYSTEEWIDFVKGASAPSTMQEMQKHLDSGCKRCARTAATWQKVQSSAAQESSFRPPADTVRVVKAAFGNAGFEPKPGLTGIVAELIFDSFQAPAVAG